MPRIKFTRDYKVKADDGEKYVEGQEVEVSEVTAKHFISRGAAVEVKPRAERIAEAPVQKKPVETAPPKKAE